MRKVKLFGIQIKILVTLILVTVLFTSNTTYANSVDPRIQQRYNFTEVNEVGRNFGNGFAMLLLLLIIILLSFFIIMVIRKISSEMRENKIESQARKEYHLATLKDEFRKFQKKVDEDT